VAAGVPVAIATDVNPGGGFSPSMPFAMALACFGMHMTVEEAVVAATINAAFAIDRHDRVGSLEPGKQLDAVVVRGDLVDLLRVGATAINSRDQEGTCGLMLTDKTFSDLLKSFSTPDPTPGGGTAGRHGRGHRRVVARHGDGAPQNAARQRRGSRGTVRGRRGAGAVARYPLHAGRCRHAGLRRRGRGLPLPKTTDEEKAARKAAIQAADGPGHRRSARGHAGLRRRVVGGRAVAATANPRRRATCSSARACSWRR